MVARSSVLDIEQNHNDLTNAPTKSPAVVQNTLLNTDNSRNKLGIDRFPGASTMPGFVASSHVKQRAREVSDMK